VNTLNPAYFPENCSEFRHTDHDDAVAVEASEVASDARSVLWATLAVLGVTVLGICLAG
jgi:hypothetical protein